MLCAACVVCLTVYLTNILGIYYDMLTLTSMFFIFKNTKKLRRKKTKDMENNKAFHELENYIQVGTVCKRKKCFIPAMDV